jgi:hypothetical protein
MMFKDPLQTDETPYEILGLAPDASPADVKASLARFLRDGKNLPRLALARQALRKLKTTAERAQVDLMLYSADAVAEAPAVPSYPANELYSDVTGLDWPREARASLPADLKRYDDLGQIDWTPEFDR